MYTLVKTQNITVVRMESLLLLDLKMKDVLLQRAILLCTAAVRMAIVSQKEIISRDVLSKYRSQPLWLPILVARVHSNINELNSNNKRF